MATYILLWNPKQWDHSNILRMINGLRSSMDGTVQESWRFMSHKTAKAGDHAFLLKTGSPPRGLFGHGVLQGKAFRDVGSDQDEHWMFNVLFDELVDPIERFLLPEQALMSIPGWVTQRGSGNAPLDDNTAARLHEIVGLLDTVSNQQALKEWESQTGALTDTERQQIVSQRIGQGIFRDSLLRYWRGRCCISGLDQTELLRASHIRDWAHCQSSEERLDVHNGLLLAAHLDAAFDAGLITVNENGVIHVSSNLSREAIRQLGLEKPVKITGLRSKHQSYLEWHRRQKFQRP